MKNRGFRDRLGFALARIATGWRRERSFRTQTGLAVRAVERVPVVLKEWGVR